MVLAGAVWLLQAPAPAHAQTLADYSRAQRRWLEAQMQQNVQRLADAASAPRPAASAGASAPVAPGRPAAAARVTPLPALAIEPPVRVAGVFVSAQRRWVELQVDGQAQLLAEGQPVAGSAWWVQTVSAARVVLARAPLGSGRTLVLEPQR